MSAETFIDTNVFVYHLDASDAGKHAVAEQVVRAALRERSACISFQVVQECLSVVCGKARIGLTVEQARAYLDAVLLPLMVVGASAELYQRSLAIDRKSTRLNSSHHSI